jgi:hypothetical protein
MLLNNLQLMHVSEVRPSLIRLDYGIMNVQVTVFLLSSSDHLHKLTDCLVNLGVIVVSEKIAGPFDPFGNIAIPEEMKRHRPHGLVCVDRMPLELEAIISAS